MSRPPLGDLARSKVRELYLTPAEAAAIDTAAAGRPLGAYVVDALRILPPPVVDIEGGALLRDLSREPQVWSLAREREAKALARRYRGLITITQCDRLAAAPSGPRITVTLTTTGQRALDLFLLELTK